MKKIFTIASLFSFVFLFAQNEVAKKIQELAIPYNGPIGKLDLYKVNLFAEGFHVDTDKAKNIAYDKGVHYRGIVKGDYNSVASFNFFPNELNGVASNDDLNNLVIGKLDKTNNVND